MFTHFGNITLQNHILCFRSIYLRSINIFLNTYICIHTCNILALHTKNEKFSGFCSPVALSCPDFSLTCQVESTTSWNGQRENCYYQKNCFILQTASGPFPRSVHVNQHPKMYVDSSSRFPSPFLPQHSQSEDMKRGR